MKNMSRKPKFDITVAVRDVEPENSFDVATLLGQALAKINLLLKNDAVEAEVISREIFPSLGETRDDLYQEAILRAGGSNQKAAKLLGVSQRSFYRWLNQQARRVVIGEVDGPAPEPGA